MSSCILGVSEIKVCGYLDYLAFGASYILIVGVGGGGG